MTACVPDENEAERAELRLSLLHAEARLAALRQEVRHAQQAHEALLRRPLPDPPPPEPIDTAPLLAPLQARIAQQDAEIALLAQHLEAFRTSAIWRATWPLRRVLDRHPALSRAGRRALRAGWWTLTLQWPARLRARSAWHAARLAVPDHQPPPAAAPPEAASAPTLPEALPAPPPSAAPPLVLPTARAPVVSVIVPAFGQVPATLRCLRAVAASDTRTPFEVILAEDASGDPEVALLEEVIGLRLLRRDANLGFLHNCNEAALHARGRYLLFLNNDTEPLPGFLDALVRVAEALPDAGLVGSKLLFPDGRLQEAGGIIWQDGTGWNYGRGDDPALPQYNTLRETDYVSGASILLRRDLFEELHGFDPAFAPAYYEDVDLAFRLRARGLRVIFQPASVVIHHEGLSHGTDPNTGIKAQQEVNRRRMTARWPRLLAEGHMAPSVDPIRACEHARGRPTILVIDHYVPEPDRDAGSRSTMAILSALKDAGWLVKFWPQNRAHNRYTCLLETMGIEVLDRRLPEGFGDWIARNGPMFDHVLVMRPTVAVEFVSDLLRHTRARLGFYGVDVHHLRMRRQAILQHDPSLAREADEMERLERRLWGVFDVMLYPSEVEAALVRRLVPGASAFGIVPFSFDRFRTRTIPPPEPAILFVAGFAHPPNVDAATWLVREILPLVRAAVPQATLVLAGSHPTASVRALGRNGVVVTGSLDQEELDAQYRAARVGIVPLRVGAGVKGKVVEAMQQGLPLVTTTIGAEGLPGLEHAARVADTAPALAEAVVSLLRDDRAWSACSTVQRAYASERFSRAALAASLFAALDPATTQHRSGPG